ncbi:MAG: esterase [Psychroserpens sp.]|jgi:esterase
MTKLLNYQQSGSGKDIILIHGLFGRLENLNMVAKALAENFRVTSVDVRNHGDSFHHSVMNYPAMAQDIADVMQHLAINSAVVLGHSMGGKIAMELALTMPELVEKLIIADIAPVEYPPHHSQIITGLKSLDFSVIMQRKDADKQLAKYLDDVGVRQFLLRNLSSKNGQLIFKCSIDNIAKNYPQIMKTYQGCNSFQGPTLFIKGANSDYILPEHRTEILRLFPQSRARVLQGAGHWLHAEKTIAFNRSVEGFLAN